MDTPQTLIEAVTYFSDHGRAHEHFVKVRWPNGMACPRTGCGSADDIRSFTSGKRKRFRCMECKRDFTAKVGTIFEDSPLGLDKWLPAIWLLSNAKNGISSCELAKALGVTQKTAWFMLHRIRLAMRLGSFEEPLSGRVEADETFVGGKQRTKWRSRAGFRKLEHGPGTGKTTVLGMVQRSPQKGGSRVRAFVVPDHSKKSLLPRIYKNILPGSILYTDALRSYRDAGADYVHHFIDHSVKYVEGHVHTNTIENFWACLKRSLNGTYIAPRAFHLEAYVNEQVFRFNERGGNDAQRFMTTTKAVDGKRLTLRQLHSRNPKRPRR